MIATMSPVIAESRPAQSDLMIRLVLSLLENGG